MGNNDVPAEVPDKKESDSSEPVLPGQPDKKESDSSEPVHKKLDAAEFEVESADAGASVTFPMQCSALRKNGFVVIKSRPCKIVEMTTSKTGKHGHAKVHLTALDIFTGKKLEEVCPSTHNMDVPNVRRQEYQLLDITDDGFLNMITDDGNPKDDIRVPPGELGDKIKKMFSEDQKDTMVVIQSAMREEAAIDAKETTK